MGEFVVYMTGVKVSKLLYDTYSDFSAFTNVLNANMRIIYIMGIADTVDRQLRVAQNSKDLYAIARLIEKAEIKDVDIDKFNMQELEAYCIVFDNKYKECLHDNFLMWQSMFGNTFESSICGEIREYIEACSN